MLRSLFEKEKRVERGTRSTIMKELENQNLEKLEKELLQRANVEFSKRPRLTKVLFASYIRGSSLGKGCKVLVIYRDGYMSLEHRQGVYGAILSI